MARKVTGTSTWLPRTPSVAAAGRVFCLPYAGCGASIYHNWPREQDSIEFLPVELPGRETRLGEPAAGTFTDLARAMVDALDPYLGVPFAFFGHCWSALAAYEATAELHRAGSRLPMRLFVSSQVAPQDGPVGRMIDMDDAQLAAELAGMIEALGGEPHPELVSIYLDILRGDIEMSRRYHVPHPLRLTCPITAIGWTDDEETSPGQMTGWSECGDTAFEVLIGPHHRFIDAPPELLSTLCSGLRTR
jgi:surfactin synthase thioesterase subunit